MPDAFTKVNLAAVDDAAPANGFGDRWQARVARDALKAERTGVTFFRLHPGKRSPFTHRHTDAEEIYVVLSGSGRVKLDDELIDVGPLDCIRVAPATARAFEAGPHGLEFLAFGAHHPGDGEAVDDAWTKDDGVKRDDTRARLRDEADRERFAVRELEERMAAEARELAREGEVFEEDLERAERGIAAEQRMEHWGHDPDDGPPG